MQLSRLLLPALALTLGTVIVAQTDTSVAASESRSQLTAATGFDYSRGNYGLAEDTTVLSVPLEVSYDSGPWIFRLLVPWINIDGPATVVGTGAGTVRPVTNSQSGLGDTYLGATYRAGTIVGAASMDVTVRAKLPTADEARGLGTGETDLYSQVDVYRSFGSVTPFTTLGWRSLGRSAQYPLRDGAYASGGAHFRTSESTVVTTSLDWSAPIVAGGDHATSATLAVTRDVTARWRLMAYGLKGFTDATPDVGGGLRATYRF